MAQEAPVEAIKRYLQDAIAAEQNFESQLRAMANEADQLEVKQAFSVHADETRRQHERLAARLRGLGGDVSGVKGFMAHLFGFAPKAAQLGHADAEKSTQDLMISYAVEHSEIAMYESLAQAASLAGDTETEALAREIQQEERRAAEIVWSLIGASARDSFSRVTGMGSTTATAA